MKKITLYLCSIMFLLRGFFCISASGEQQAVIDLDCPSAILIERSTGQVLYEKDADTPRPMASVTKIMTLLLIVEALDDGKIELGDMVTCSEHAASMGGSQVYLKEGESMSVDDMLKAIVISSGNDAAVAMAEHIAGSDAGFVEMMNERAEQLKMKNTHFVNCTGLDTDDHYSSARDIGIMSIELLKHKKIRDYTTVWMDTLRDGSFGLSNTNKLVRFYEGCTGLKTGSTSKALYCMSASAERNGMELIAVVMASPTSPKRFEDAKKMLNYGFAGYEIFETEADFPEQLKVQGGKNEYVGITGQKKIHLLVEKGQASKINVVVKTDDIIVAPAEKNTKVGEISLVLEEEILQSYPLLLSKSVPKARFWDIFLNIFRLFLTV